MNIINSDGFANIFTGVGIKGKDKRLGTKWIADRVLTEKELNDLYRGEGFSRRIVDIVPNDMTRQGFYVTGDTDNNILEKFKNLNAISIINRALKWSRLYGGAILIIGANDGGELAEPLNENNISEIEFLRLEHRYRVNEMSVYLDETEKNFGEVETYRVSPIKGNPYIVHETRVFKFDGVDIPDRLRLEQQGWGDSVLQVVYPKIRGLGEGYTTIELIMNEFILGVLRINGLSDLIATKQEHLVTNRLNLLDMTKHTLNTMVLDAEEEFTRLPASSQGIENLIDKMIQPISAVTGIPTTLLMGMSPAGLQATGDSDIRFYYDMIKASQQNILQPCLEWLVKLCYLSKESPFNGVAIDDWEIKFNSLWQQTDNEKVDVRTKQSQIDNTYFSIGVLTAKEIRDARFSGKTYSLDTNIEDSSNKTKFETDIKNERKPNNESDVGKSENSEKKPTTKTSYSAN